MRGLKLEIVPLEIATFLTDFNQGDFQLALASINGVNPDALYLYFHSGGAQNYGGYCDPATDAALERARRTPDQAEQLTRTVRRRLDLTRPVDRAVVEECLDLALQAPNGKNEQEWDWVVIDDPNRRIRIADLYRRAVNDYRADPDRDHWVPATDANRRMTDSVKHLRHHAVSLRHATAVVSYIVASGRQHCGPGSRRPAEPVDRSSGVQEPPPDQKVRLGSWLTEVGRGC